MSYSDKHQQYFVRDSLLLIDPGAGVYCIVSSWGQREGSVSLRNVAVSKPCLLKHDAYPERTDRNDVPFRADEQYKS